jgi:LEA14-like dessication related protein
MHLFAWLFICVLVTVGIMISGCSALVKSPDVSVTGVSLSSASLSELALDVSLLVDNPNSFGITLKTVSFDVYYQSGGEWVYLSHGEAAGLRIEPGKNNVTIPVTVGSAELLRSLAEYFMKGEITLQVRGNASPDFYGIAPKVPFTKTTTIKR